MTKREAIRQCQKLWDEIEKSGLSKDAFLNSPAGKKWLAEDYLNNCPLCEYSEEVCSDCPLVRQYGKRCWELGFHISSGRHSPSFYKAVRGLK